MQPPFALKLKRKSRELEVVWGDGVTHQLACEYLRVYSPSAEVRGHGIGEPMLIGGKRQVNVARVDPVGRYAVRLAFDDGHDSGIYTWDLLYELGTGQKQFWARYMERLQEHRMSRDSDVTKLSALGKAVKTWTPPKG